MRLLRILNELRPSGVEASLASSGALWRSRDIHTDILAIAPDRGPYAGTLEQGGYRVIHIPLHPFSKFLYSYVALLHRSRYDLVHVHTELANFYIASVPRLLGVPVVRGVHSVFAFTGLLWLQRRLQRQVLRSIGVTHVSISPSVQEAEWRYYRNPTTTILNWYDDSRFHGRTPEERSAARTSLGLDEDSFAVVTVGNCRELKNHGALLEALSLLPPEIPAVYLHAGVEDTRWSERSLAARLGVTHQTEFLGPVQDVPRLLAAADCFVMPSLYEGFGNAALEALGRGVLTILADVPGLRDFKPFFPQATYVAPQAQPIADALIRLAVTEAPVRFEAGQSCVAAAQSHFSARRAVEAYANLYSRLLPGEGYFEG